jgi:hypothetical protein
VRSWIVNGSPHSRLKPGVDVSGSRSPSEACHRGGVFDPREKRVATVRERLAREHGLPRVITTGTGTEFASRAVDDWAHRNGVKLDFIVRGSLSGTRTSRA